MNSLNFNIKNREDMFSRFARWLSEKLGSSFVFIFALFLVIVWLLTGPYFQFSNTWQLVINTLGSVVTFLMVFLIQNTQNRDTIALHLKLDEIIRSSENAHNELLKVEQLDDKDLEELHKRYENLALDVKSHIKKGHSDLGTPDIKKDDILH